MTEVGRHQQVPMPPVLPPAHGSVPSLLPGGPPAPPPMPVPTPVPVPLPRETITPAGVWRIPILDLQLPTPLRLVEQGVELLRDWHPRDPRLRFEGRYGNDTETSDATVELPTAPVPPAGPDAPTPPKPDTTVPAEQQVEPATKPEGAQRSQAAKVALYIGLGGGVVQNAIDVVRLLKKYPEALRAGKFDPSLGRLGRLPTAIGLTALTRPDNRIIDPRWRGMAASIETGGRTFDAFDDVAMKASVLLGASLAAIQIGSSIPNLVDALSKDGAWHENLVQSTSGRAGMLQLAGGTIGAAVFSTALLQTRGQGSGVIGRILAAGSAPINARPIWGRIGLGTGLVVAANELGYLDFLNKGETRSVGQVLSEAVHKTPVLNDPEFRTAAILGAGGIVGFKAHRAIQAAGGISGMRAGHWIGAAAIGTLLGAQLLGGLSSMNKPE